jgi:hypothetical protein
MTGDRDKFLTLRKERDGSVSFGNDDSTKIVSSQNESVTMVAFCG